jgi:hypothetical protein
MIFTGLNLSFCRNRSGVGQAARSLRLDVVAHEGEPCLDLYGLECE